MGMANGQTATANTEQRHPKRPEYQKAPYRSSASESGQKSVRQSRRSTAFVVRCGSLALDRNCGMSCGSPSTAMSCAAAVLGDADLLALILSSLRDLRWLLRAGCTNRHICVCARSMQKSWAIVEHSFSIRGRDPRLTSTGFYFHRHVAWLPSGDLCAPDMNNRCLRVLSPEGEPKFTLQHAGMRAPRGPATDGTHLYAVEAGGQSKIHRIPLYVTDCPNECITNEWSVDWDERPSVTPDCCAVANGLLYVSYSGDDCVVVLQATSLTYLRMITGPGSGPTNQVPGERFNRPQGLAALGDSVYICDSGHCRVCVFSHMGTRFELSFGGYGDAPGQFSEPRGIALLPMASEVLLLVAESRRLQAGGGS